MIQPFTRPEIPLEGTQSKLEERNINSLPDLVQYNAIHNPNHVFGLQEIREAGQHKGLVEITFLELQEMMLKLESPVAIYLESDMTLFASLCALLYLNVPIVLVSARLSSRALAHLLSETSAQSVLCSTRTRQMVDDATVSLDNEHTTNIVEAISFQEIQVLSHDNESSLTCGDNKITRDPDLVGTVILHSSGTTGLPKPIRLTNRYILGYAACHKLSPEESDGRTNLSTLPLYHGFGLLPPCLSLSTGKTCCFPSPNVIPSADSAIALLQSANARSLMTVPTILEQIVSEWKPDYRTVLAKLDFIAIGGGPLKHSVGDVLARNGVTLLNHYGATEIGAIAHISIPDETYDWHYLRLRTDIGLQLDEIDRDGEKSGIFRLSGYPFGWNKRFEIQDDLEKRNYSSDIMEVKILGRTDEVIVLSTGEKVSPQIIESTLGSLDFVRAAVVFGQQRSEIGVLVELKDLVEGQTSDTLVERLWDEIQAVNSKLDGHSRIPSKASIIVKPRQKAIVRSDKGSIMRNEVYETFKEEIDNIYNGVNSRCTKNTNGSLRLTTRHLHEDLMVLVQESLQDRISTSSWGYDDDFFEFGMDSLEATRLARLLERIENAAMFPGLPASTTPMLIYRNPTITKLAETLRSSTVHVSNSKARTDKMMQIFHEFKHTSNRTVILLTGSTGNLGAHILGRLAMDAKVHKIVCLNRERPQQMSSLMERQMFANTRYGVNILDENWNKIDLRTAQTHLPNLGLDEDELEDLHSQVTHVIHNAWPMDLQRSLESYESQLHVVNNLIEFCAQAKGRQIIERPSFIFLSSIAVAGHHPKQIVSEQPLEDPSSTAPVGYAEAKWICEKLIASAAEKAGDSIQFKTIRIGQISGSQNSGYWNPSEHVPQILKASQETGALPDLQGTYSWLPVDTVSQAIVEISMATDCKKQYFHVENPIRQPWKDLVQYFSHSLQLPKVDFQQWMKQARESKSDTIKHLLDFLQEDFLRLSGGGIILSTEHSRDASPKLRSCSGISLAQIDSYVDCWKQSGHLCT